ncbi:sugar ABC transporter permease [Paenibacillus psychroresistens]|uniref:Sugar ABC transporter permease n=1 Tax=Paenibacillus psychroresistens TaxID=1778678 RepID=A0A6B8RKJ6_9BACL|nr:ABC transporter permease subunit [Paenibacillus psychroresistens]QGQ96073.1 sugar ABC transporter permease [Paenibacillus psychroresistens]
MISTKKKRGFSQSAFHIMLLPAVILVLIYSYGPIVGIIIAFQDFVPSNGWFGSEWIGLDNFRFLLDMPDIKQVLKNTVLIALMKMVVGIVFPVGLAILLNEIKKVVFKRTVQTIVYLPYFLSWVILSGILIDLLSPSGGFVNEVLVFFHIQPIYFLGNDAWFRAILIVSHLWKEIGFDTIIYLAAILSIDKSLYEASALDGAGHMKQVWHITLPGMIPIIVLLSVLSMGNILNAGFDQIFNLYSPQVYTSSDILDTFVYRLGLQQMQYGVATAVGLIKSVVSFIFISVSYYMAYKIANYRVF